LSVTHDHDADKPWQAGSRALGWQQDGSRVAAGWQQDSSRNRLNEFAKVTAYLDCTIEADIADNDVLLSLEGGFLVRVHRHNAT